VDNLTAITFGVTTQRLERAVELLGRYHPEEKYPEAWRTFKEELDRRKLGATWHHIVIARRHLVSLPFAVKEALQLD
jgi:hypothetical protein